LLAAAIIVFREVLEAALIVGIVMAATKGLRTRGLWTAAGIAAGVAGAGLVAVFGEVIANAAAGIGQELLNAAILFTAVVMLAWHNVWMNKHGREMAGNAARLGRDVVAGDRPLYAVAIAVGMAVLREGAELVLFLYSIATSESGGPAPMLGGGLAGLAAGASIGVLLYYGLLRIPTRYLFTVTSWMILLLAAGMASQGAAFLVQADVLPELSPMVWDTSFLLADDSIAGRVLHTLIGYVARPAGIQVVFYLATLVTIAALMRSVRAEPPRRTATA
jgi:high-affinity iron transporter